jgi:hypothetical protein
VKIDLYLRPTLGRDNDLRAGAFGKVNALKTQTIELPSPAAASK